MAAELQPVTSLLSLWPKAVAGQSDRARGIEILDNPLALAQVRYLGVEWINRVRPYWLHHLEVIGCPLALEQDGLCRGCVRNGFTAGMTFATSPWLSRVAKVRVRIQRLRCIDGLERRVLPPQFSARWRMDRNLLSWLSREVLLRPAKTVGEQCGVDRGRLADLRGAILDGLDDAGEWHVQHPEG